MIFSYLFEAKAIQQYLFRTGRLKDTIAASERLDRLVDSTQSSVLYQVLETLALSSDLIDNTDHAKAVIRFTRCKAGGFYAFSQQREPLQKLRALWTLTVQQMLAYLEFSDGLGQGASVPQAIQDAEQKLNICHNIPVIKLPLGTAIMKRTVRTGLPTVLQTEHDKHEPDWDIDTDYHRQAHHHLKLGKLGTLQDKFTPQGLEQQVYYPTNFEKDFWFSDDDNGKKDIAIIHIDGNGLGQLQYQLKAAIEAQNLNQQQYCQVLRGFSNALSLATQDAAQSAGKWLYGVGKYTLEADNDHPYMPMRPLVLGGDDITLLCHARWAMQYVRLFCAEFEAASKKHLHDIYQQYLTGSKIKPYLTASGSVLYHKSGHAFSHTHRLIEDLTIQAKKLTKQVSEQAGPAALAFFRLSSAATADYETVKARFQHFDCTDEQGQSQKMMLGMGAFLLGPQGQNMPQLTELFSSTGEQRDHVMGKMAANGVAYCP